MYFDSATTPNTFWVRASEMNFAKGAPVIKLPVAGGRVYSGDASGKFEAVDKSLF
jgi:hypothetical protein